MKARGTFVLYQVPSLSSESISYHPDAYLPHIGLITAVDATMKVANKASVYSRTTNGKVQVVDLFVGGMFTGRIHYQILLITRLGPQYEERTLAEREKVGKRGTGRAESAAGLYINLSYPSKTRAREILRPRSPKLKYMTNRYLLIDEFCRIQQLFISFVTLLIS